MAKFFRKKNRFDEDADWVPQKGRVFEMKTEHPLPNKTPVFTQKGRRPKGGAATRKTV